MEGSSSRFQRAPPKLVGDLVGDSNPRASRFGGIKITGDFMKEKEPEASDSEEESSPLSRNPKKREREKTPPPPAPPQVVHMSAPAADVGFLVRFVVGWSLFISVIFFYGVVSVALTRGTSLPHAVLHLFAFKMLPPMAASPVKTGNVYPLFEQRHDTQCGALDLTDAYVRPLVASLEPSFRHHLLSSELYPCLCMHHIKIPSSTKVPLCAVRNRDDIILMANPRLIGKSNETIVIQEHSITCDAPHVRARPRAIMLAWENPKRKDTMYSLFEGDEVICMQIAMDEMQGDAHCQDNKEGP